MKYKYNSIRYNTFVRLICTQKKPWGKGFEYSTLPPLATIMFVGLAIMYASEC